MTAKIYRQHPRIIFAVKIDGKNKTQIYFGGVDLFVILFTSTFQHQKHYVMRLETTFLGQRFYIGSFKGKDAVNAETRIEEIKAQVKEEALESFKQLIEDLKDGIEDTPVQAPTPAPPVYDAPRRRRREPEQTIEPVVEENRYASRPKWRRDPITGKPIYLTEDKPAPAVEKQPCEDDFAAAAPRELDMTYADKPFFEDDCIDLCDRSAPFTVKGVEYRLSECDVSPYDGPNTDPHPYLQVFDPTGQDFITKIRLVSEIVHKRR